MAVAPLAAGGPPKDQSLPTKLLHSSLNPTTRSLNQNGFLVLREKGGE